MQATRFCKVFLTFCFLAQGSIVWTLPVAAEVAIDLYGGLAKTKDTTLKLRASNVPFTGSGGSLTTETFETDGDFNDSFTVGGRVTYWFQRVPWLGGAFDVSYFKAEDNSTNIDIPVYGFSFLLMLRYPLLVTEQIPQGRLQPYLGIGPEFAFGKVKAEFKKNGFSTKVEESEGAAGVDVRTGLLWQFYSHWGLFTEYRFTYLDFDTEDPKELNCEPFDQKDCPDSLEFEDFEGKLTTHHFLMGLSFRF